MTRWDWESNESVYERCGMGSQANGVNCRVVEWVKRNILRWFGHIERMVSKKSVKKVYMSESVGPNSRGRPTVRWRNRVKEYMCERGATRRGGLDQAKEGVFGQGEVETSAVVHPLGGTFPEEARPQSHR